MSLLSFDNWYEIATHCYAWHHVLYFVSREFRCIVLRLSRPISNYLQLKLACCQERLLDIMLCRNKFNWNHGLPYACATGNVTLVDYLVSYRSAEDLDLGFPDACESGNFKLVKYLVDRGATCIAYGIMRAKKHGHTDIIQYLTKLGTQRIKFR